MPLSPEGSAGDLAGLVTVVLLLAGACRLQARLGAAYARVALRHPGAAARARRLAVLAGLAD